MVMIMFIIYFFFIFVVDKYKIEFISNLTCIVDMKCKMYIKELV